MDPSIDPFVVNVTRNAVLARRVVRWSTVRNVRRALASHGDLGAGEGLVLAGRSWIHTFGLARAIDVVFLDADSRVVVAYRGLEPDRISMPSFRGRRVLSLPEGILRATGTELGDRIELSGDFPEATARATLGHRPSPMN